MTAEISLELVQDLGGVWSRPFVVDGDPFDVDVAIIGLNPATEIKAGEIPREMLHELLLSRHAFEEFYVKHRLGSGKKSISPTRR
jgi:hypothetical protein